MEAEDLLEMGKEQPRTSTSLLVLLKSPSSLKTNEDQGDIVLLNMIHCLKWLNNGQSLALVY